jgi:hypothetical protein
MVIDKFKQIKIILVKLGFFEIIDEDFMINHRNSINRYTQLIKN